MIPSSEGSHDPRPASLSSNCDPFSFKQYNSEHPLEIALALPFLLPTDCNIHLPITEVAPLAEIVQDCRGSQSHAANLPHSTMLKGTVSLAEKMIKAFV